VDVDQVGHGAGKVDHLANDCEPVLDTADFAG
jgi:hypothetical protein